ncbi:MAG: nucleotide pyrophosphohydrolase [Gammaproteobacteria bacterium]|nr:MAG: nucleotide pyrophosphohydrolase [Gammaproteobacteria bacterium]
MSDLDELRRRLREFAAERDWGQFHTPKNLAMALVAEGGELLEHFQWLTADESAALPPARREAVAAELADMLLYLIMLADRLDIDLVESARNKIEANERRYPADRVRGSAEKAGR